MKPETLLSSLQEVDEDLLDQSIRSIPTKSKRPLTKLAVAAALLLAVGLGAFLLWRRLAGTRTAGPQTDAAAPGGGSAVQTDPQPTKPSPTEPSASSEAPQRSDARLPLLSRSDSADDGPILSSREEVVARLNENLWTSDVLWSTLPVFENQYWAYDVDYRVLTLEDMMTLTESVYRSCGLDVTVVIYPPANGQSDPETLTQRTDTIDVSVTNRGRVTITYHTPLPLGEDVDAAAPRAVRRYYLGLFQDVLSVPYLEEWELAVQSTRAANDLRYAAGRLSETDDEELFLADQLRRVELELDETGALVRISYDSQLRAQYLPLGDYPLRSVDDAREALPRLQYFLPTLDTEHYVYAWQPGDPALVELVYPTQDAHPLTIPCYRFWAPAIRTPLDGSSADAETVYVPYYVPAIPDSYFDEPPEAAFGAPPLP